VAVFAYVAAGMLSNVHTARSGLLQCNKYRVGGRVVVRYGRIVWPSLTVKQSRRNSYV